MCSMRRGCQSPSKLNSYRWWYVQIKVCVLYVLCPTTAPERHTMAAMVLSEKRKSPNSITKVTGSNHMLLFLPPYFQSTDPSFVPTIENWWKSFDVWKFVCGVPQSAGSCPGPGQRHIDKEHIDTFKFAIIEVHNVFSDFEKFIYKIISDYIFEPWKCRFLDTPSFSKP